jgi:tetratricopeptide repeat protein 30
MQQTSPEEAYRRFEIMASKQIDMLRKLMKQVQEDRKSNKDENIKKAVQEYDDNLEK